MEAEQPLLCSSIDVTTMSSGAVTTSVEDFILGTGKTVLAIVFEKILQTLEDELLFVTCFWAPSDSLRQLSTLLLSLSNKALSAQPPRKIRVRICLSSLSIRQKLFDLQSERGHLHSSKEWNSLFGLPKSHEIRGLDLRIMSIFKRPFCVMHPKFMVVDRSTCFLPSCNVSWEDWFEGCIELRGPIVSCFVSFWEDFWKRDGIFDLDAIDHGMNGGLGEALEMRIDTERPETLQRTPAPATFLPSTYHRNPRFRPFPCQRAAPCPKTPLNVFTLDMLTCAKQNIFMQTPNVTSPPVCRAILAALQRGVHVRIVTNEKLMTAEQLVTAGTTTPKCLARLIRRYNRHRGQNSRLHDSDAERGAVKHMGSLRVDYFANPSSASRVMSALRGVDGATNTHFKCTIVDESTVLLGSGNMDRASWYTSQELGVAITSHELATALLKQVREALIGKLQTLYDSRALS